MSILAFLGISFAGFCLALYVAIMLININEDNESPD